MADNKPGPDKIERGVNAPSAPELPTVPPLTTEFHEHDGRRWPTIIVYLIIALFVAALIVLVSRTIYRSFHHSQPEPTPTTNIPQEPATDTTKKTTKPTSTSSNTAPVPNTGPGDTVALFVGTALVAGGLHYLYQLRKAQ
jgi:hypothetical protein